MRYRVWRLGKPLFILAAAAALGWMVMLLWNAVIPAVFIGGRSIDYVHALGLLLLSRILFGGFRGHGGWGRRRYWRRWEAMTPEEREQFQQSFVARCKPREERT
jgi:hypothetical protein